MSPFTPFRRGQPHASSSAPRPVPRTSQTTTPLYNMFGVHVPQHANDTSLSRMKTCLAVSLDMLQKATSIATEIDNPDLSAALSTLTKIIKKLQTVQTTVEGVETLRGCVASLLASVEELRRRRGDSKLPDLMGLHIEELSRSWGDIQERVAGIRVRGKLKRFLTNNLDAKVLGGLVRGLNESIQDKIIIRGVLNIEHYVYGIHVDVKAIEGFLNVTFMPRYAKMAPYYANDLRRSCLDGTRVDFLHEIYTWIIAGCKTGEATPDVGIVLWINGLAGTGKTTVAHTVSAWCDSPDRRILGGSFFCSRSDNDCSDPTLIFPTLCRQLCVHHRPFGAEVEAILKQNPDIADYGLYRQFEELIVLPLEALKSPFPRTVFVLDALDELKPTGQNTTKSTVLRVIAKFAPRIARFLLLVITSRPEVHITALFEAKRGESLKDTTTPLLIHNVPIDIALRDIRLYVDHEFDNDIGFRLIEPGWPSAEERNTLAEQARGLYIFVATAIKFILDEAYLDPKGQMDLLSTSMAKSSTPYKFLSTLYTTILVASYERASPALASRLRDVLGTVVLAHEALSPLSIAKLVGLDAATVRSTLTGLHSVLHIPADDSEPIRLIHPTFPEFLLQSPDVSSIDLPDTATVPAHLRLQPAECHWYLFSRCVEVMSATLKRDMIGARYPAMFQSEIDNLKERVNAAVEPHVRYSSRFWGHHLRNSIRCAAALDIPPSLRKFVHEQLLYWIEMCSWLDAMDNVIFALNATWDLCQMSGGSLIDLVPFLADCRRFILSYSQCIHAAPLQLYHLALAIAPITSPVRAQYPHECEQAVLVEHGASTNWLPCVAAIAGHSGALTAVASSPDGSCFVTAGADGKATIRKAATRTPILSFDGHTNWPVRCVAFSPDALHVASGADDRKVCVWQASSGEPVHTLQGHTSWVFSVAYSGDGRRIVSATKEGEVKLWDTTDGRCLLTLDKTGNETLQVGFSFDGGVIARGDGSSLSLYNVSSATSQKLELPDPVKSCTFSPDGRYITARSRRVIRVWAMSDKSLVRSIDVPYYLYGRLAFSCDSVLISCGSEDGSVRLWQVASKGQPRILQGHADSVNDLAWNPATSQVISVSEDNMVLVWDSTLSTISAVEHVALEYPPSHTTHPPCFALIWSGYKAISLIHLPSLGIDVETFEHGDQEHSGRPTATLFSDVVSAWDTGLQAVNGRYRDSRLWASFMGQQHTRLSGRPFAISADGSLMAYPSPASDKTVNVFNLRTGAAVATLTEHGGYVFSVAFSPDNASIVTGSEDKSVNMWETFTGSLLHSHTHHQGWTLTVAFSTDGRSIISGSGDKTVHISEASKGRVVHSLGPHRGWVMHAMLTEDNAHLVALDYADWVYVWDIATGTRIRELSTQNHNHLRAPFFSPDNTGILVSGDDGAVRTVSLWKPGARTWPAYHITLDGWVYAMRPTKMRRLCWLPSEWRLLLWFDSTQLAVGGIKWAADGRRRVAVLNMSRIIEYIDTLDVEDPV